MREVIGALLIVGAGVMMVRADVVPQKLPPLASTSTVHVSSHGAKLPYALPTIKNEAFAEGESLQFVIKYEFVGAGTAEMNVKADALIDGRPTYRIETKAESNHFVDKFFKVRDFNASVVDQASLLARNFHQNLREGKYTVIRNTTFDYDHGKYIFQRTRRGTTTQRAGELPGPVMDVLGAFFYTRTLDLHPGDQISIAVFSDEEMYPLSIKVDEKIEKITVGAGTFDCLKIEPLTVGDAIFKSSDGRMQIWLTNDRYKMPVLIRSKVFIGAFDCELTSFKRPAKPGFDTSETK
jgi:hypothetical protein